MSILGNALKQGATKLIGQLLGENGGLISLSCNGTEVIIPVDPSSFSIQVKQLNSTVDVINTGEVNMLGKTGLKTISFSGIFPAQEYSFNASGADTTPYSYVEKINHMRTAGKAAHISIEGALDIDCSIESFKWGEDDGSGDVSYSLELREYIDIAPTTDALNKLTGLKKPKMSFLQRTGLNAARSMLRGQSPMRAITGAVAASGLTPKQQGYLKVFEAVSKGGGIKAGDLIEVGMHNIKINNKPLNNKKGKVGDLV